MVAASILVRVSTAFDLFAVGPDVTSLEEVAAAYEGGGLPTFGTVERVRAMLSSVSSTVSSTGVVVVDERCGWTLDLTFSFDGDEVSSITAYVSPRADAGARPKPLATLVAEVAAALGGSAFRRETGARETPRE
jgi:hypothetical protein